jgi:hypothetical protein
LIFLLLFLACIYVATTGNSILELPAELLNAADDAKTRGRRVTNSTPTLSEVRAGRPVNESPEELAAVAGVSVEAYTLARVIRSERKFGGTWFEGLLIGWIAKNIADSSGWARIWGSDGRYGRQGGDAWVSTSADPYEGDVAIALGILGGRYPDPTNGAKNFVHPGGFGDAASYLAVKNKWMAKGLNPVRFDEAPGIEVYV